jgi:hypothetical protein
MPNGHKLFQMAINYYYWKLFCPQNQHFPIQGPPKYTQIGIFGTK